MELPKKIIKVQIITSPIPEAPIMTYDAKCELICYFLRGDVPVEYDRLTEISQSKGTFGFKAYWAADVKKQG